MVKPSSFWERLDKMSARLDRLSVAGFKSIEAAEVQLAPGANVLIGANGSGKTNLIEVFRLMQHLVDEQLQTYVRQTGGASSLLTGGPGRTPSISLEAVFREESNGYQVRLDYSQDDSLFVADEMVWYHDKDIYDRPYTRSLNGGGREASVIESDDRISRYVRAAMESWRVYHFHDTSPTAPPKLTADVDDNRVLRSDAANLAPYLYMLREVHPARYKRIVKAVRLVAPFFHDFVLEPTPHNPEKIRLKWRQKGMDADFSASALSDGTLRFVCLATVLLMPNPPETIIVDEPELGLHPYAITALAALIRSLATSNQLLLSTQSVPLVNQFLPADVIIVDRLDGRSVFTPAEEHGDLQAWADEFAVGMGDLWERNLLGGRPS